MGKQCHIDLQSVAKASSATTKQLSKGSSGISREGILGKLVIFRNTRTKRTSWIQIIYSSYTQVT